MDLNEALTFLNEHQPMADDENLAEWEISKYREVCNFLKDNPNEMALPLLLNSFGNGSCFGLYQLCDEVLSGYPIDTVIPYLIQGIQSDISSIRYWCINIAASFSDIRLIEPLAHTIFSDEADIRMATITALFTIDDSRVNELLQKSLDIEKDDEIKDVLIDAMQYRRDKNLM